MSVKLSTKNGISIENVRLAEHFWTRFLGLMGRRSMPSCNALLLMKCGSIHTFFMRFSIDVVYFSRDFKVIGVQTIRPWRFGKIIRGVNHILEIPSGNNVFKLGDVISIE